MESMVGMESMGKASAQNRMNQTYQKAIQEAARTDNLVRKSKEDRPVWYETALDWLGSALVAFGTRLQSYKSIRQTNIVH